MRRNPWVGKPGKVKVALTPATESSLERKAIRWLVPAWIVISMIWSLSSSIRSAMRLGKGG